MQTQKERGRSCLVATDPTRRRQVDSPRDGPWQPAPIQTPTYGSLLRPSGFPDFLIPPPQCFAQIPFHPSSSRPADVHCTHQIHHYPGARKTHPQDPTRTTLRQPRFRPVISYLDSPRAYDSAAQHAPARRAQTPTRIAESNRNPITV